MTERVSDNRVRDVAPHAGADGPRDDRIKTLNGGFDAAARGPDPHKPLDNTLAKIAEAVYDPGRQNVDGWRRLGDGELAQRGIDPNLQYSGGNLAGVYTDGQGHYTVAFAGNTNNEPTDIGTIVAQALGADTTQYNNAISLGRQVESAFGPDNVIYTGHSHGGGLASATAMATGSTAVTFNAAGVSDGTLSRLGLDPAAARAQAEAGQIRTYSVIDDFATLLQQDIPFVNALPDPLGSNLRVMTTGGHNMDVMIRGLDGDLPIAKTPNFTDPIEKPLEGMFNFIGSIVSPFIPRF
ncbi:hypothetical protein [Luteimonas aquatica]|uniref:hypothetical protein n=1 Tax=Luteimonas aquatica TaxID=450364 RepID=UPI001F592B57|nr:hypothetical protein [Luteimonas aquatica]